jgi:iron complex outermembrane receptor protein
MEHSSVNYKNAVSCLTVIVNLTMNFQMNRRRYSLLSSIVFCLLAGSAIAQETSNRVIEEVIVTAQKRAESLQDVPVSVSSFSRDFMSDMAVVDIGELVQYTPNVKFNNSLGHSAVLTIRGFGTPPLGRGLEPSVGLSIDDVFYGRSTYINDANFDLERIEVLRGPQGTLFGKNTIAGVFNLSTRDPDFDGSHFISIGTSKIDETRAEAAASITLIEDVLALRVAAYSRDRDSHVYNTARNEQNTVKDLSGRIKLKWFISDSADVLLNVWSSRHREVGLITQIKKASAKSLNEFQKKDPGAEADEYNDTTSMNSNTFSDRDTESSSIKYRQDLGSPLLFNALNMEVIVGKSRLSAPYAIDGDFSPIDFIDFGTEKPNYYRQEMAELRFSGGLPAPFGWGFGVDFIAGAFASSSEHGASISQTNGAGVVSYAAAGAYYDPANDFPFLENTFVPVNLPDIEDDGQAENLFAITDVESSSVAYFTQFDWYLTETVTTIIGLRYGEDSRQGRIISGRRGLPAAGPITTGQENFDITIRANDYDFTPKLTVSWQPYDELTLFATATEGFKSGGFAAAVFTDDNLTFEPETATAYEAGFKSKWLGGSLMLNGAIFHTSYRDLQVRSFDGRSLFVKNAADAETKGFEFDFFWLPPVPYLSIGGSAGIVDAKYIEFVGAPSGAGPGAGAGHESCFNERTGSADQPTAPSFQNLSGESLAYAPEVSGSLYTVLNMPLFDSGINLLLGVDAVYQGEHFIDTDNDPVATQEATTKINARIGLKAERWSIIMNGKNLSEEQESVLVLDQPGLPGNYVSAALPDEAVYQLDFRYHYD